LRSERACRGRCSLTRRCPRTLSPAASLGHLVKGWLVTSSYPAIVTSRHGLPRSAPHHTRKMRWSDFCNRSTIRAPQRLPNSRVSPSSRFDPRGLSARRRSPAHPSANGLGEPPGEASLDGEPPASALSQPAAIRRSRFDPIAAVGVTPRGPGGASIERSSALRLPAVAFSTASRSCDVASDALCRGCARAGSPLGRTFSAKPPGTTSTAVSSKTAASPTPGRLPSTSAVSPAGPRPLSLPPPRLAPPPGHRFRDHPKAQDHR